MKRFTIKFATETGEQTINIVARDRHEVQAAALAIEATISGFFLFEIQEDQEDGDVNQVPLVGVSFVKY